MTRHDENQLWDYAGRALEFDETKMLEHHLEECPECNEKLEAIVLAREALLLARQAKPSMAWAGVDSAIEAVIDRRLRSKSDTGGRWRWLAVGGVVAAVSAAAVAFFAMQPVPLESARDPVLARASSAVAPVIDGAVTSRVEVAKGLQVSGLKRREGAELKRGDVLQTNAVDGKAIVHLADQSHVRVANGTALELRSLSADSVDLVLLRGRVSVRASHQPRTSFVVRSGDLEVLVVGTVFAVSRQGATTEVSVSEGQVRVETTAGDAVQVAAGQRVRFTGRNVQRASLTPALVRELAEVQNLSEPAGVPGAPVGPAMGGPLPRLDPSDARARQVVAQAQVRAPSTQVLEPLTEVLVEAPPTVAPGQLAASSPPPTPAPEAEWAALPPASPPQAATLTASAPAMPAAQGAQAGPTQARPMQVNAAKPLARDLESIFLEKAEAALTKGTCESYLLGLEEVAGDAQLSERTELARVLRARCFNIGLRPKQALIEYRKYLEAYPAGRFVAEAHEAMGH